MVVNSRDSNCLNYLLTTWFILFLLWLNDHLVLFRFTSILFRINMDSHHNSDDSIMAGSMFEICSAKSQRLKGRLCYMRKVRLILQHGESVTYTSHSSRCVPPLAHTTVCVCMYICVNCSELNFF
jgi:hypothetical protein